MWERDWKDTIAAFGPSTGLDGSPKSKEDLSEYLLKMGPIGPDLYPKFANTIDFYDKMTLVKKS